MSSPSSATAGAEDGPSAHPELKHGKVKGLPAAPEEEREALTCHEHQRPRRKAKTPPPESEESVPCAEKRRSTRPRAKSSVHRSAGYPSRHRGSSLQPKLKLPASPKEMSIPVSDELAGEKSKDDVEAAKPETHPLLSDHAGAEEDAKTLRPGALHAEARRRSSRVKTPPPQSLSTAEQSAEHVETRKSRIKHPPRARSSPAKPPSTPQSQQEGAILSPTSAMKSQHGGSISSPLSCHSEGHKESRRSKIKTPPKKLSEDGTGGRRSSRTGVRRHRLRSSAAGPSPLFHGEKQRKGKVVNIYCRLPKPLQTEQTPQGHQVIDVVDNCTVRVKSTSFLRMKSSLVDFDAVLAPGTQDDILNNCQDLVHGIVDGHSGTILSYGQTSAEKTFTMFGLESADLDGAALFQTWSKLPGVVQKTSDEIFKDLATKTDGPDYHCVTVSVILIYANTIMDLLDADSSSRKICTAVDGADVVEGLIEHECVETNELIGYLGLALCRRSQHNARTGRESSAGTTVVMIRTVTECAQTKDRRMGKLILCDLVGSEHSADVARSKHPADDTEAAEDLAELGDILESLHTDPVQASFLCSQSKRVLIKVMRDALAEAAHAALIIHCTPSPECQHETLRSLEYAARMRKS